MDNRTETLVKLLEERKDLQKYLFIRGFLITNKELEQTDGFPFYGTWEKQMIGSLFAYTHHKTRITVYEANGKSYFLLGHAYDPFTMIYKEDEILKHVAEKDFQNKYQDAIDDLTGVFVTGYVENRKIKFQVDPSGMQSAYYGIIDNCFYIMSHPQIVGDICHLEMSPIAKELINYKWYSRVMGCYLPADISVFDEVKRVVPNIEYLYGNGAIEHKRFYPLKQINECSNEEEYSQVIQ